MMIDTEKMPSSGAMLLIQSRVSSEKAFATENGMAHGWMNRKR